MVMFYHKVYQCYDKKQVTPKVLFMVRSSWTTLHPELSLSLKNQVLEPEILSVEYLILDYLKRSANKIITSKIKLQDLCPIMTIIINISFNKKI